MIVAELRVIPMGEGTSMHRPLERVVETLDRQNVRYQIGAMGTTLEADTLEDVLKAVSACHKALREGVDRIVTDLAIDERLDKEETADTLRQV